jgi:hypothetical protein
MQTQSALAFLGDVKNLKISEQLLGYLFFIR